MPYAKPPEMFDAVVSHIQRILGPLSAGLEFKFATRARPFFFSNSRDVYVLRNNKFVSQHTWELLAAGDSGPSTAAFEIARALKMCDPNQEDFEEPR